MSTPDRKLYDDELRPHNMRHVRSWIFDLDNTLYPSECNLFAQVDQRMGEFIAHRLGLALIDAKRLQKDYYYQYGTTLAGLMHVHDVEPDAFLDYVHDIDVSVVESHPELATAIARLPGRKLIYTNGSRRHAERVAEQVGVLNLFDEICSIETCEYVPKPKLEAFERMIRHHNIAATDSVMFEDLPHNLEVPHAMGMTTVLVKSQYLDHPAQRDIGDWEKPPEHIHYMTDDLCGFLAQVDLSGPTK